MSKHALFSPSGASKWIRCPGSLTLERGKANPSSKYAIEGTAAHTLAEKVLTDGQHYANAYLGEVLEIADGGLTHPVEVTEDMVENVQDFVDAVFARIEEFKLLGEVEAVELKVEQEVDFSGVIGVPEQFGTADIVILVHYADGTTLLSVEDLKYGMGVAVEAEGNEQLTTYAAGIYDHYSLVYDITKIIMAIHQVRLHYISETELTPNEVLEFGVNLRKAAQTAYTVYNSGTQTPASLLEAGLLEPGDKQCRWCRAAADCPALADRAFTEVSSEFEDFDDKPEAALTLIPKIAEEVAEGKAGNERLGKMFAAVELWDILIKAVQARVSTELLAGRDVPGYKLVAGRRGHRKWTSNTLAEDTLKAMRLKQDEMYTRKLISPAQAEKQLKKSNPRRWNKLLDIIEQPEGNPSVAPISDKRPALDLTPSETEFEDFGDDLV